MSQKISSLLWDIMLLAGFIYVLLVMHKVVKAPVPVKTIERPTPFIRVLVYLGVLLFAILFVLDILGK